MQYLLFDIASCFLTNYDVFVINAVHSSIYRHILDNIVHLGIIIKYYIILACLRRHTAAGREENMNIFRIGSPFMVFMSKLLDILVIGVIAAVCCLPVITVGASITAVYYTVLKMVRRKEGSVYRFYFKAFKENFWKATALWLIVAVVGTVLYADYTLLMSRDMAYESVLWIGLVVMTILAVMVVTYVFPMQAQFENTVFGTIKNSFILSIMNLPRTILILLVKLCPVLVAFIYPEIMYLLIFLCLAGIPYMEMELFVKIFDKYIPDEDPGEEAEDEDYDAGEWVETNATPILASGNDLDPEE